MLIYNNIANETELISDAGKSKEVCGNKDEYLEKERKG